MHTKHHNTSRGWLSVDVAALLVAPLGVAILIAAQVLAGVPVSTLLQKEAALIVFGGTLAALLVTYSPREVFRTLRACVAAFGSTRSDLDALAATMVGLAVRAHRQGLVAIDAEAETVAEPFLREGLGFAIDEASPETLREVLAAESTARTAAEEAPARVLEAAAGYAPTLGILGAVLGLIHVMRGLGGSTGLGSGIAVAFVATVYGVGAANLVLLPLAGRLRERALFAARRRDVMTLGICAIQQRIHPRVLTRKLRAFGIRSESALPHPPVADTAGRRDWAPAADGRSASLNPDVRGQRVLA
jgi:chemotaxis protein MotA